MDDAAWALVAVERTSLVELLAGLVPAQWESPSLCSEWRVRDVAAHLAMTPVGEPGVATMVRALVRTRGDLWGAGRDVARAYARRPAEQIVTELRSTVAARTKPVFVVDDNILLDLVVHGQDIAVPLAVPRPVPEAAGVASLRRVWAMGWPFRARRRLAGVQLEALDGDWSAGAGPAVRGTMGDLLLLATRRSGALDRLGGPGVDLLRAPRRSAGT